MTVPSQKPTQPNIEFSNDIDSIYANLVRIAHSPSELILDFAHLLPGNKNAKVRSRIVMSPLGAKLLYRALGENLTRYENSFGEIQAPGQVSLADHLFRNQNPEDGSSDKTPPDTPPQI